MVLPGISPEDSERLLVRPLEVQLKTIEGLKEIRGTASQGYGAVSLEFDVNFNKDRALQKVRDAVDTAKSKLPSDAEEPFIFEANVSDNPVVSIILSGNVPERALLPTPALSKKPRKLGGSKPLNTAAETAVTRRNIRSGSIPRTVPPHLIRFICPSRQNSPSAKVRVILSTALDAMLPKKPSRPCPLPTMP